MALPELAFAIHQIRRTLHPSLTPALRQASVAERRIRTLPPACGGAPMPITEFMNGLRIDPETRRLMGLAYELTRVTLRLSDRKIPLIRSVATGLWNLRRLERGTRCAFVIRRWPASDLRRAPRLDN